MNYIEKMREIYLTENDDTIDKTSDSSKIVALYLYYHYFNADTTKLSDVSSQLINQYSDKSFQIKTIIPSCTTDNAIDIISFINKNDYFTMSTNELIEKIKNISYLIRELHYHFDSFNNTKEEEVFQNLEIDKNDDTVYCCTILCPYSIDPDKKIETQQLVNDLCVKNEKVIFNILFNDDLDQEIYDIDDPKECVARGNLGLMGNGICSFGNEKSLITLISAKSLKQLFFKYSTKGLFSANLRYYVTSKKIDKKIIDTIQNESEEFCYLNNGIVITCTDYNIVNDQLILSNFSIVNGGQTTNLIGRTNFNNDFGIVCKVIKSRFDDEDANIEFLSKVAEASNTQKPIKAKDLIANKIEQRKLKIQFAEAGMFLRVKRGEKIDKQVYPKPYMNATNEEVAQLLFSTVYQSPGFSKNSCSSLLSIDKYYDVIFKNEYCNNFLKSIQIIKVAYCDWKKQILKTEMKTSIRYGLSKHMNLQIPAMICFVMKVAVNDYLFDKIKNMSSSEISIKNDEFKNLIKCNDVGKIPLIREDVIDILTKKSLYKVIDFLIDEVSTKAYKKFKRDYPNYAYGNFAKLDRYYYDYVLPVLFNLIIKENNKVTTVFSDYFNMNDRSNVEPKIFNNFEISDSFKDELLEYRQKVRQEYPELTDAKILRTMQIANILKYYPKNKNDLKEYCGLNDEQIDKYGEDIINITASHIRLGDFE